MRVFKEIFSKPKENGAIERIVVAVKSEEATSFSKDDSLTNWSNEDESRLFITSIFQNAINVKINRKIRNDHFDENFSKNSEADERTDSRNAKEVFCCGLICL